MTLKEQIARARQGVLDDIEAFLIKHDMPASTFGRLAMADPCFVFELRGGRKVSVETIDSLRTFLTNYRPPKRAQAGNAAAA